MEPYVAGYGGVKKCKKSHKMEQNMQCRDEKNKTKETSAVRVGY